MSSRTRKKLTWCISSFRVCDKPQHFLGGQVKLLTQDDDCESVSFNGTYGNPPVDVEGMSGSINAIYLDGSEAEAIDTDLYQGQTQMITINQTLNSGLCLSLTPGPGLVPVVFAKYNQDWYIHSPRFKFVDNTPTNPMFDGGASIVDKTSGDEIIYQTKCSNVARSFLNEGECFLSNETSTCAVDSSTQSNLICGSPFEISNDLALGGTQFNGAFDTIVNWGRSGEGLKLIKKQVWSSVVLTAPDQLRQRMAWALSQILVINDDLGNELTEKYANYYDIFVKHAFGNYRDILKEVSYSPMMAFFLSYHKSKSTHYHVSKENGVRYPDEVIDPVLSCLDHISITSLTCFIHSLEFRT